MRVAWFVGCVGCIALAAPLLGCAHEETQPPQQAAAPPPPREPVAIERARVLMLAAELQMRDLKDIGAHATDDALRASAGRQLADIEMQRDRLRADLAVSPDSPLVERDIRNLQRAMRGAASALTQPQAPPPPPETRPAPAPTPEALPAPAPEPEPAPAPSPELTPAPAPAPEPAPER